MKNLNNLNTLLNSLVERYIITLDNAKYIANDISRNPSSLDVWIKELNKRS